MYTRLQQRYSVSLIHHLDRRTLTSHSVHHIQIHILGSACQKSRLLCHRILEKRIWPLSGKETYPETYGQMHQH